MPPTESGLICIDHALARHKLAMMRDKACGLAMFGQLMREVGLILCAEATRDLAVVPVTVQTPLGIAGGVRLAQADIMVVPILRAGLVFADAFRALLPNARTGHIGLFRDHASGEVATYLTSIRNSPSTEFFIVDPMIASANTIEKAVEMLLDIEVPAERIRVVSLLAARPGIERFYSDPRRAKIRIYTVEVDEILDERGYLVPGLGDAGDRLFGS